MLSFLPSLIVLGLVAVVAAYRAGSRSPGDEAERRRAARRFVLAITLQGLHFVEEVATGFDVRFPALFDLPAIPFAVFVGFNLAWIIIWIASVPGVQAGHRLAFFAAWFLAIAGVVNLVAHPLLAVFSGGYFPGLYSAPLAGLACVWLWRALTVK